MNVTGKILTLKSEFNKGVSVLERICQFYDNYLKTEYKPQERKMDQAIVVSNLICSYYTCLETIFLRISQFFENALSKEKWRQESLQKMTLQIEGVRDAAISDNSYLALIELLRFRHFKRYYFELEYDWDKLEFIQKKLNQVKGTVTKDLDRFLVFLDRLEMQK